jgi:hypothetical protein
MTNESQSVFQQAARNQREYSLIGEFWAFLSANKKWWLLPLLAVMLLFALLMLLSTTAAAPFIYTLF